MKNQAGARLVYQNAKNALYAACLAEGMNAAQAQAQVDNAVLAQSYLRLEQQLTITSTNIVFPILANTSPIRITEQRLNLQDIFYVSEVGFYLLKAASATDAALTPHTYPNAVTFPTGAAALYDVYNGNWDLSINNSKIIAGMDLMRFLMIPETQLTAATNSPQDEFYGANDKSAQCIIEPNILLSGQKNNQITVNLKAALTAVDTFTYLGIFFRGILMQNTTIVS